MEKINIAGLGDLTIAEVQELIARQNATIEASKKAATSKSSQIVGNIPNIQTDYENNMITINIPFIVENAVLQTGKATDKKPNPKTYEVLSKVGSMFGGSLPIEGTDWKLSMSIFRQVQ